MHCLALTALSLLTLVPLLPGCATLPPPGSLGASRREVRSRVQSYLDATHTLRGPALVDGRGDTTRLSLSDARIGAAKDNALFGLPCG